MRDGFLWVYNRAMTTRILPSLSDLSSNELHARLGSLRAKEREGLVSFLHCLAEIERRKVHAELGFPSIFAYLVERLGLSKCCAFRRSVGARLMARFPVVAELLAHGRLNLTSIVALRDVLDDENHTTVLERAAHMTEDEVKDLAAELTPPPPPPPAVTQTMLLPLVSLEPASCAPPPHSGNVAGTSPGTSPGASIEAPPTPPPPAPPGRPALHTLRLSVDSEFRADLARVRDALGHKLPGATTEQLLQACMRALLVAHERRKVGAKQPRAPKAERAGNGRYIPAAVRRAVWDRDGSRCTYVAADGHRCCAKRRLEFDHIHPFALGGPSTVDNIRLRCATHNRMRAERELAVS